MSQTRITFVLPFKVTAGMPVYDTKGNEVGVVMECEGNEPQDNGMYLNRDGNVIDRQTFTITADVEESVAKERLQCMEPTLPIP